MGKREVQKTEASGLKLKLEALTIIIGAHAGEEGKLFGSVTNIDIERALREKGFAVERRKIHLAEPIKQLGEFTVPVRLQPEVEASLKVEVKAE
jgi:large subunit ribosomal protein L9